MSARGTRGGRRQGSPGKVYAQRTDLNANRAPIQGEGTVTPASGGLTPIPLRPTVGQPAQAPPPAASAAQPAPGAVHPDQVTPLDAPTDRPLEPVTAGIGSPALGVGAQWASTRDVVSAAAAQPGASPALQAMAERLHLGF